MIKSIVRTIRTKLLRRNPLKYARKIGVNFEEGSLHLYGNVSWGTEPWIIKIGDNVHLTEGVRFITHDGGTLLFRDKIPDLEITKPIVIGNNVYIGNNVIILPGVEIGDDVIIGAGAVVSRHIPSNSIAVGVPAQVIKTMQEYFDKIKEQSIHLGHLQGEAKDKALREYYHYTGKTNGIYL